MAPKRARSSYRAKRSKRSRKVKSGQYVGSLYKKPVTGEIKALDTDIYSAVLPTIIDVNANGYICLNVVNAGSAAYNRIGRKIKMLSCTVSGVIQPNGANPNANTQLLRFMCVYDNQLNGGALPGVNTIIQGLKFDGSVLNSVGALPNLNNKSRFMILMDKYITCNAQGTAAGLNTSVPVNLAVKQYMNLRGLETTFSSSTGQSTDIVTGALYLILLSNSGTAGEWRFSGQSRVRFLD